jgi:hypothetical protein
MNNLIKAELKNLRALSQPDGSCPAHWMWESDPTLWRFETSLSDPRLDSDDGYCGYVSLTPTRDGAPLEYDVLPSRDHNEWLIGFLCHDLRTDDILVHGNISEAKRQLDNLLAEPTPEIKWEGVTAEPYPDPPGLLPPKFRTN